MRLLHLTTSLIALTALAYDNETGWKLDADGKIETDSSGNPIMVAADGKESALAPGYVNRINAEAATHRRTAKEALEKLAKYGDLDPDAARTAVEKMKDVDLDQMVNKGEIDKIKQAVLAQYEPQLQELTGKLTQAEQRANDLLRKNAFSTSKFLNERLAVPRDFVEAAFQGNFKIEDGNLIPIKSNGDIVYNNQGEVASVDEAFEFFISARPDKDQLLRAPAHGGTGSGGGGGNRGGGNVMKRADFDKLAPMEKAAIGKKVGAGEMKLVD